MNSLHKLVEDGGYVTDDFMPRAESIASKVGRLLDGVKCFDIGESGELSSIGLNDGDEVWCPLMPYEHCWFEWQYTDVRNCVWKYAVLSERRADGAFYYCFRWCSIVRRWQVMAQYDGVSGDTVRLETCFDNSVKKACDDQIERAYIECINLSMNCLGVVARFLKMLACVNVDKLEVKPDRALQKARLKRGRLPLFSTWVCVLKGKSAQGEWLGGTHTSPRLHYRRGHVRNLEDGRAVWVRECMVGNKELGLVEKSYMRAPDLGRAAVGVSCE